MTYYQYIYISIIIGNNNLCNNIYHKNICIVLINGKSNKHKKLKQLTHTTRPNIITVQETKLTTSLTLNIPNYTPIRTKIVEELERGLLTYNFICFQNAKTLIHCKHNAYYSASGQTSHLKKHNAQGTQVVVWKHQTKD